VILEDASLSPSFSFATKYNYEMIVPQGTRRFALMVAANERAREDRGGVPHELSPLSMLTEEKRRYEHR
jgi:hypothetical protein